MNQTASSTQSESLVSPNRLASLHPKVFRIGAAGEVAVDADARKMPSTGFSLLDAELFGSGWQRPGLTEILCSHTGIGELSLLMKGLAPIVPPLQSVVQHVLWVMTQEQAWVPYAPALRQCGLSLDQLSVVRARSVMDALWTAEQGLKSGACRCVVLQVNAARCNLLSLRRLQQAAIAGGSSAFLLRPLTAADWPSPAGTRIALIPEAGGVLRVTLLKRRGLPPGKTIRIMTRSLSCLGRAPVSINKPTTPAAESCKQTIASESTGWLDPMLALTSTAAGQVQLRARTLDPNRR